MISFFEDFNLSTAAVTRHHEEFRLEIWRVKELLGVVGGSLNSFIYNQYYCSIYFV